MSCLDLFALLVWYWMCVQMQTKVAGTGKYSNVKSQVATGATAKNQQVFSVAQRAKMRNEKYFRIKPSELVGLIQQQSAISGGGQSMDDVQENIYSLMSGGAAAQTSSQSAAAATVNTVNELNVGISSESNYVVVDMRDNAEYRDWHIKESYSFPLMMLNQDKTIPELHRFKNKDGKMIVCYTSDERNGIQVANAMVDRGYENTYLLSGGIEKFIEDYPNLVEGMNVP